MTLFSAWISRKLGTTRWVVAHRMTTRLADKGYTIAISERRFSALRAEWSTEGAES